MDPSLILISGVLKGVTFSLIADEVAIGRDPANDLHLNELSISRRHCLIKRNAGPADSEPSQFTIVDLESFNGTFVNGVPVREQTLAHGDQIALGDAVLLFLLHEVGPETVAVQLDEDELIARSTVRLLREDALYLCPDKVLAELPATARIARDLNTLLKVSTTINSVRGLAELQPRLLELIRAVMPAERQAILLTGGNQEGFSSICGWSIRNGQDNSVRASRTIANQVLRERIALLSNDLVDNQRFQDAQSLIAARVCSVLCAPLVIFEKAMGVLYLDTSDPTARFDEGHLQLLTAMASFAAVAFENARQFESLESENARLQESIRIEHQMVGESAAMRAVHQFIDKVAPVDSTVLIRGESGTGKELAANEIHLSSPRAAKPFLALNCATLSEALLESELFGHEKGAFTGAITQKRGKFEIADGGTVFLDEVGELAPVLQAKLLRVLQTRQFERLGGTRPIKVDVRVIAATNRNLEDAIRTGGFRQDLYYRLNVVALTMPALRDRPEDIPLLASYFVTDYSKKCKRKVTGLSPEVRQLLCNYDWPGNVRELENAIERAVVLGSSSDILPEDLPEALLDSAAPNSAMRYYDALKQAKRQLIIRALAETNGNYTEAAKLLAIHPNNLHRLIRGLDLKAELKR